MTDSREPPLPDPDRPPERPEHGGGERARLRRKRRRRALVLLVLALGMLAVPGVGVLVRTTIFREWAARRLVTALSQATQADVTIGLLTTSGLLPPVITLHDVQVTRDGRTLVSVEQVTALPRVAPLVHGQLHLASLHLRDPVIRLDADDPMLHPRRAAGARGGGVVIDAFEIEGGRGSFRDVARGLEVDVAALRVTSPGLLGGGRLFARVEAEGARLALRGRALHVTGASARIARSGGRVQVEDLALTAPGLRAWADGEIELPGDDEPLRWTADAEVEAETSPLVALGLLPASTPVGAAQWEGSVRGRGRRWLASGRLRSDELAARTGLVPPIVVRRVDAQLEIGPDRVRVSDLDARAAGGRLAARAFVVRQAEGWVLDGQATLEDALADELPLPRAVRPHVPSLRARARLEVSGSVELLGEPGVRGTWSLDLEESDLPADGLPARGSAAGALDGRTIVIASSDVEVAGARLAVTGSLGTPGAIDLEISARSEDLAVTASALATTYGVARMLDERGLTGSGTVDGAVTGTSAGPILDAAVTAQDAAITLAPLGAVSGTLRWEGGRLQVPAASALSDALEIDVASLEGSTDSGLADVTGDWVVHHADLALLAGHLGRAGAAAGHVTGAGTFVPSGPGATAAGTVIGDDLTIAGLEVDRAELTASADEEGVVVDALRVARGDGEATARGRLPWRGTGGALEAAVRGWPVELPLGAESAHATLGASGTIGGAVLAPALVDAASFRLDGVRWRQIGPLAAAGEARWSDGEIVLALDEAVGDAGGVVRLEAGGGRAIELDVTLAAIEVELPGTSPERRPRARFEDLAVHVAGRLGDTSTFMVDAIAAAVEVATEDWRAEAAGPVRASGRGGAFELHEVAFDVAGQRLLVEGSATLGPPAEWEVLARGSTELRTLESLLDVGRLDGEADLQMRIASGPDGPRLDGELVVRSGYVNAPVLRHSLQSIEARIEMDGDVLRLVEGTGRLGGGLVEATGELELDGWSVGAWRFRAHGESVALRAPEDVRSVADVDVVLEGVGAEGVIAGDVRLQRARVLRDVNLERALLSRAPRVEIVRAPSSLDGIRLDLRVRADEQLVVDNDLLSAEFRADMDVVGTAAQPVLLGTLDTVHAGALRFQRVDYTLTSASALFTHGHPNDPEIEARAETRLGPYDVTMVLTGRLSTPSIELTSRPEIPHESLVALLLTGGAFGGSAEAGGLSDTLATAGAFTGAVEPLPASLERRDGPEPFRLDAAFVEDQALPSARLTLGRQLGERVYAAVSSPVWGGTNEAVAEVRYRAARHLDLRLAREEEGPSIAEVRWVRSLTTGRGRARAAGALADAGPKVRDVAVSGIPADVEEKRVLDALGLGEGRPASRPALLRAARDARQELARSGRPLAVVTCDPSPEAADGRVDVSCAVTPGPRVTLEVAGLEERRAEMRVRAAVEDAWSDLAFQDELVPAAAVAAQDALLERGLARATIRGVAEEANGELRVSLVVDPGEPVRVGEVLVEGVEALDPEEVREVLASRRRAPIRRQRVTTALLDRDVEAIESLYRGRGYMDATVATPGVTYPADPSRARLTFRVDEGSQYRIAGIRFTGDSHFSEAELLERFPLDVGDVVEPEEMDRFGVALVEEYDALGHPDASVTWRLRREDGGAIVEAAIVEGPEVRVGDVRIEGLARTRDEVVLREVTLERGDLLTRAGLDELRRRLRGLGLFDTVIVRGEASASDPSVRDVVVRLGERDDLDMSLGLGMDDEDGPRLSVAIGERNIAGRGHSAGVQARLAGGDRLLRLIGGLRRLGGSRVDLLAMATSLQDERDAWTADVDGVQLQLSRPVSERARAYARLRLEDVEVDLHAPGSTPEQPLDVVGLSRGRIGGIGFALLRDTRDDPLLPSRGSFSGFDVSWHDGLLGSDFDFVKVFLQHSRSRRFGEDFVVSASARVGAAWPIGSDGGVPLSERFFAGGVTSVRGWERDHLGPKHGGTDPHYADDPVGGEGVIVLNVEVRRPLTRRLTGIVFVDAGNVVADADDLVSTDLEWTTGPGIAIGTPVGPIRLYHGWKLGSHPGESDSELHFTFGPTF